MNIRRITAVWAAKLVSKACRILGYQGVTLAGRAAFMIDRGILSEFSHQIRKEVIVVCGTNGKTTTNNLICTALEQAGKRVVCNHTGSNMFQGVVAAFVLAAGMNGKLNADYACIEVDEASAVHIFPEIHPDYMVLTNLFRDQLDRYGEIDITMNLLKKAAGLERDMLMIINGDDPLAAYLAQNSGRDYCAYGISEKVFTEKNEEEVKEGSFCKCCGARLKYEFYHYGQLGKYRCGNCGFERPGIEYEACDITMENRIEFEITAISVNDRIIRKNHVDDGCLRKTLYPVKIQTGYKGFYNIYNILAAHSVLDLLGIPSDYLIHVLKNYKTQNGRMERFTIDETEIILNLAKNPIGFNQNIAAVLADSREKNMIIVINDHAADGVDVSWLWDVDFEKLKDSSVQFIVTGGKRCLDMRLRLKYAGIDADAEDDTREAIKKCMQSGCRVIYILVNYTALFRVRKTLIEMNRKRKR